MFLFRGDNWGMLWGMGWGETAGTFFESGERVSVRQKTKRHLPVLTHAAVFPDCHMQPFCRGYGAKMPHDKRRYPDTIKKSECHTLKGAVLRHDKKDYRVKR